jgi:hypothetical protein
MGNAVTKSIAIPITPLILLTGISHITTQTSKEQAKAWTKELEALYTAHYQSDQSWTWDDTHDLDRDAFVELEAIMEASDHLPLGNGLISSFLTPEWRTLELLRAQTP